MSGQPPAYGGPDGRLPPPGFIALTIQGNAMSSSMLTPNVLIDGRPVPASYGQNTIPVYPGPHRVELSAQWLRRYGQAALDLHVAPGQSVPVFYRAPLHQFSTGSIGHERQKAKGKGCFFAILGVVAFFLLVAVLAAVFGS